MARAQSLAPSAGSDQPAWRSLYPFASHRLETAAGAMHYLDEGQGEPILCVHGNPTWSFYWRAVVEHFRGTHRVVAPDHLGCGLSDKPQRAPYRLGWHIENLVGLVDHLDLRNITLVCHDWGGAIGLGTALARPERFARIALTNTAAFRDPAVPWRIRLGHLPGLGPLAIRGFNAFARAAITQATEQPGGLPSPIRDGLLAPYDCWANRVAIQRFVDDIPRSRTHPSYLKLAEIEGGLKGLADRPLHLIWGMRDWCFSPHFLERFHREFFPEADVTRLETAGHYVLEDAPAEVLASLERLLATSPRRRTAGPVVLPRDELLTSDAASAREPESESANIARHLPLAAESRPEAPAVVVPEGRDRFGRRTYLTRSFAELNRESDSLAAGLRGLGVQPGMRLALMCRPGVDFIALTFAVFKAGAVAVLIDPGMGLRGVLRCLDRVEPDGFLALGLVQRVRWILKRRYRTARFNVSLGPGPGDAVPIDSLRGTPSRGELHPVASDDPAAIIFTSGSTGPAKGVLYQHGNFDAQVRQIRDRFGIQPGGRNLAGFPLFALFDAAMGTTTVVPDLNPSRPATLDPVKVIETIHDWQCNQAFGSPAIWNKLGRHCQKYGLKLPSLRRVLSAGAPVPPDVLRRLQAVIHPEGRIHTPYGATEALPVSAIDDSEVLGQTAAASLQGRGTCVGTAFSEIRWQVIAPTQATLASLSDVQPLPTGETGELIVQGPCVTTGYWRDEAATARSKIADAAGLWHRMGDCGHLDAEGRFWFAGRMAERVATAEGPLDTVPIETIFNAHPRLLRTALVGVGATGEQQPILCVEVLPEHRKFVSKPLGQSLLLGELLDIAGRHAEASRVTWYLMHPGFPVDVRHNAKIKRDVLAVWATKTLANTPAKALRSPHAIVNDRTADELNQAEWSLLFGSRPRGDTVVRLWSRSRLKPGDSQIVDGLGRVEILTVEPIPATEVPDTAARAHGFVSREAWREELVAKLGSQAAAEGPACRIGFRVAGS